MQVVVDRFVVVSRRRGVPFGLDFAERRFSDIRELMQNGNQIAVLNHLRAFNRLGLLTVSTLFNVAP